MKKYFKLVLVMILALSLLTACGGGGGSSGGTDNDKPKTQTVNDKATDDEEENDEEEIEIDPCPCCPDCLQIDCECFECGESDDCECVLPGGGIGPLTFRVEYIAHYVVSGDTSCDIKTSGEAIVLMDQTNEAGHFGSAEGVGRYVHHKMTEWELRHPEAPFDFIVQLSGYDPFNDKSFMLVSFDRFENEEAEIYTTMPDGGEMAVSVPYIRLFFMLLLNEFIDEDTGFFTFPMTLNDWSVHETVKWDGSHAFVDSYEAYLELTITITPVP